MEAMSKRTILLAFLLTATGVYAESTCHRTLESLFAAYRSDQGRTLEYTSRAAKDYQKIDNSQSQVKRKLEDWVRSVRDEGLEATRKISGYHDEPLAGERKGQRSVRLNQQYRLIYRELGNKKLEILEITPHKY